MQLTTQQQAIINSNEDIIINAVAGSGKTTTVIAYAASRQKNATILYLAFNKSVKMEAEQKFLQKNLYNVKVETAHSLAYKHIVRGSNYTIQASDYKITELVQLLHIPRSREKHTEYVIAKHVQQFASYFCNSKALKISELNYASVVHDEEAKIFVESYYEHIVGYTRIFLAKMDRAEIGITHDFYLKKFQLSQPILNFDYILFDEGQDASPAMLDVFAKQFAKKIIVGDAHQQIYAWRYAINSLAQLNFKHFTLSTSFRFAQPIATLAMQIIKFKKHLKFSDEIVLNGKGQSKTITSKAILARTNLGLLLKAIEYIKERPKIKKIYFEGNINSYTYADEGASLYDVLNLHNGKRKLIRDTVIKTMKGIDDLQDYIDKTGDKQLSMMLEIVLEYGNDVYDIIKDLKEKHCENRNEAQIIFSTVHRAKGMEYDTVQLVNDFITEDKLISITKEKDTPIDTIRLNEEINLLYVAVTRARFKIFIPEVLMPKNISPSECIQILKEVEVSELNDTKNKKSTNAIIVPNYKDRNVQKAKQKEPVAYMHKIKETHAGAYQTWKPSLDEELTKMYCEGVNIKEIAAHFGRTIGAIQSRIKKLELWDKYG
jgi:F-box protein, helicase, 18